MISRKTKAEKNEKQSRNIHEKVYLAASSEADEKLVARASIPT